MVDSETIETKISDYLNYEKRVTMCFLYDLLFVTI